MFRVRQGKTRKYLFGLFIAGVFLSLAFGLIQKPQLAEAGAGDTSPPGSCSIDPLSPPSSLTQVFRMNANAVNAAPGSVLPGHPGIYSPWPPYLTSPGATRTVVYSTGGNKTVYGRYSYVKVGSSVRIEVQCSRTVTLHVPTQTLTKGCKDPAATNYNASFDIADNSKCVYPTCPGDCCNNPAGCGTDTGIDIFGCMDKNAANYNILANKDDGSCIYYGCTDGAARNYDPRANLDDGSCKIPGCTDPGASNYNPRANEDDGSCIYPGCTDPAAFNYDPHANQNDGSCKYDECANIPGIQYPMPDGLNKSGGNCYFPAPSCTAGGGISVLTGVGFTVQATVKNNSSLTLDLTRVSYSGPGGVSGMPNGGSPDIGGNGSATYNGNHMLIYPASGNVTWTVNYDQPYGLGSASVNCAQPLSVTNRPPTCVVTSGSSSSSFDPANPLAGQPFRTRVRISNPNPGNISITQANYAINNVNGESENRTGSASGIPGSVPANGTTEFATAQNIRVYDTSYDIYASWDIIADNNTATGAKCDSPNNSTERPDIIVLPPVCTITGSKTITVGLPFTATVSIKNPNPYAPLDILDQPNELTITPGNIRSNADANVPASDSRRLTGGKFVMTSNETVSFISTDELIVYVAGDSYNNWSFNSEAGQAGGDCGRNDILGQSGYTQPYARFYGNDVFAGGAYGENCTVNSGIDAQGIGYFLPDPTVQNHASYKGTAAELAVFATGQIDSVLPGSQDTTRSSLSELSFSNTSLGTGSIALGGSFDESMCADDYWAERPTDAAALPTNAVGGQTVSNITTLNSGTYYYKGSLHLTTTQSGNRDQDNRIANGRHITIYVEGDTWIGDTTYGAGRLRQIAYETGSWAKTEDIPLVRVISLGNIYIDNEVSQLDGMYVAIPTKANPGSTGEIHTCATAEDSKNLMNPRDNKKILSKCGRPLLVNGAFIAKRVNLLRFHGNIAFAPSAPEPYNSGEIAETFRFSPELYLALKTLGGGAASAELDAITSLPPAL